MVEYGLIHPDTDKRLLAYSVVLCLQQAHVAFFVARKERRDTHAASSMALMLGGLALMNLWRIVAVATQAVPQDYLKVRGGLVWMVLINTALQCGAIVASARQPCGASVDRSAHRPLEPEGHGPRG
jgi:hypothetical protein